jgi:hypothetical protein
MTPAGGMTLSSNKDDGPLFTLYDSSFFGSKANARSVTSKREELFVVSSSGFLAGGGKKIVDFFSLLVGGEGD